MLNRKIHDVKLWVLAFLCMVVTSCNVPSTPQELRDDTGNAIRDTYQASKSKARKAFDPRNMDVIDPNKNLSRSDYEDTFYLPPIPNAKKLPSEPMLPDVSQLMMEPGIPIVGSDRKVTISVTEDVPIKEVLIELSRKTDIEIEVDPGIRGGIIFRAKDRPFSEVIDRIARLADLRYSVRDGILRVERDLPYVEHYHVDFLNQSRTANSSFNITSQLLGAGSGDSGSNISTGSQASLNSSTREGDLWSVVEQGLRMILDRYRRMNVQEEMKKFEEEEEEKSLVLDESNGDSLDGIIDGNTKAVKKAKPIIARPDESSIISMNRQAGVISVLANKKQHEVIKRYLDQVSRTQSAQVLIEAKIVEVALDDEYESGIDWTLNSTNITPLTVNGNFGGTASTSETNLVAAVFSPAELFGNDKLDLSAAVKLTEKFGTTRTVSSPRISAMNNQFAVLTFAENFVYFNLTLQEETQDTTSGTDTRLTVDSEIKTVPIGMILSIQPSIDLDKGEITMNVRPTLSRITGQTADPAVTLIAARNNQDNVENLVPVVEVRELDSVLKMRNGQVMVIGGLMEERSNNVDHGIPGLSKVPWVGNAFKNVQKDSEVVETVIFLKATIIPGNGVVSDQDQEFYRKFGRTRSSADF
ncbi:MAG: hypothetical protein KDD76_06360 [Rickettsiales bacterium]|nr:hypothetical protein [Rickettsiales bacterium]